MIPLPSGRQVWLPIQPARAQSRFVKVQQLLPAATPSGRLVSVDLPPHHRTFSMSTAPTRCRDWLPQIHSFSLALALPARHSHREYLSARARRASKQVIIALVARVACPVSLRLARDSTRLIVQRYCVSDSIIDHSNYFQPSN